MPARLSGVWRAPPETSVSGREITAFVDSLAFRRAFASLRMESDRRAGPVEAGAMLSSDRGRGDELRAFATIDRDLAISRAAHCTVGGARPVQRRGRAGPARGRHADMPPGQRPQPAGRDRTMNQFRSSAAG